MAYNPYNAGNEIVKRKKQWAEATANGKDASSYAEEARAYYDELRNNGRSDVADKLERANDIDAAAYLKTLAPGYSKGNYSPYGDIEKISKAKYNWSELAANGKDTSGVQNDAKQYYANLRANGYGDVADHLQKIGSVEAGEYLKRFTPQYDNSAAGNQAKSNDVYKTGKDYGTDIQKSYDKVYDNNINVNPIETDYGKSVMRNYGIAADKAYGKTIGGNTEDAGGNVDSYAAANANRQKAAILSKGNEDILNYYNAITGRANEWAGGKAAALSQNLSQLQGNVDNDRASRQMDEQTDVQRYLGELSAEQAAIQSSTEAETQTYLAQLEAEEKEKDRQNAIEVAQIKANSSGTKSSGSGKSSGSSGGGKSESSNSGGKKYALTLTQIFAAANENAKTQAYDKQTGDLVDTVDVAKRDAYIQNLINDTQYSQEERDKLAQAYGEKYGTYLTPGELTEQSKQKPQNTVSGSSGNAQTRDKVIKALVREAVESGITEQGIVNRLEAQYANGLYTEKELENALVLALGENTAKKYIK